MPELFNELKAGGGAAIEQLVHDRRQENVALEFKTKSSGWDLDKSDKENLAKTISAFANSTGGLLVWGIEAKPDADGIDCAAQTVPIPSIDKFEAAVLRLLPFAVMPRLDVSVARIDAVGAAGDGYLLIFVERSERRPHRSEFGNKGYWKRISGSSMQMEHYDIEDAFKRASVAHLEVDAVIRDGGSFRNDQGEFQYTDIDIILRNNSNVSAQYPYLKFESKPNGATDYIGGADNVIHPGNDHHVATIQLVGERPLPSPGVHWRGRDEFEIPSTSITCKFGCLNSRRQWKGVRIYGRRQIEILPVPQDMR